MTKTNLVASAMVRPLLDGRLPEWVEPHWFASKEEALSLAPLADIGWFDMYDKKDMAETITAATRLKWLNSIYAGLDGMPLDLLRERGTMVTNGAGINAITIAEYVVMGMLVMAKGYREVVRAADQQQWLIDSPGKIELYGSRALLIGYGAIGRLVAERLNAFAVDVTIVRRNAGPGVLTPDAWRARLGEFDWIILAVPATAETDNMIGAAELVAMKSDAHIINIARGSVIDQAALTEALAAKRIGGAFLDVTTPEPLPPGDPLWSLDNAQVTMHMSGRAQTRMFERSVERFLDNLSRYAAGEPLAPLVDLTLGY